MTLDDQSYAIKDGCVLIPAGRPRVPQLVCDDADAVYQAFFADGETEAFAKIVCGEDIYEIKFLKDPALGFELQYDDYYYFVPSFEVQGEVTYTSSDASIAQVSDDGEVHIINVSDKGVVITADDGHNIEELVITRTVKHLSAYICLQDKAMPHIIMPASKKQPSKKKGQAIFTTRLSANIR